MTLRELLKDVGVDPMALLRQQVGNSHDRGGIDASLQNGFLEIKIVAPVMRAKEE